LAPNLRGFFENDSADIYILIFYIKILSSTQIYYNKNKSVLPIHIGIFDKISIYLSRNDETGGYFTLV
jgi:hypothetical protein